VNARLKRGVIIPLRVERDGSWVNAFFGVALGEEAVRDL